MAGGRDDDAQGRQKRGYRYRPADAPATEPNEDDDELLAADDEEDDDDLDDADEVDTDEDEDERPSEFWPAAEILKGATITDAELELSYSASVYVNTPAAELRLWLKMPDGTTRHVQIDEPHGVWLYHQAHPTSERDFEEYPDHRFELPSSDLRVLRARQRRQLIDRQLVLHEELVAIGEELEELDRDTSEDESGTADWPGTKWP